MLLLVTNVLTLSDSVVLWSVGCAENFHGTVIQWRMVSFVFDVRCL